MALDENYLDKIKSLPNIEFMIPAADAAEEFSNIYLKKYGDHFRVQLNLMLSPDPTLSKAWRTGLALDASASMKNSYGRRVLGNIPVNLAKEYKKKGWLNREIKDGRKAYSLNREAVDDALEKGLVKLTRNVMDYLASEFVGYLAGNFDVKGKTTLIYWAGGDGSEIERIDQLNQRNYSSITVDGPDTMRFGSSSKLLPAVKYFVEQYSDKNLGLFVFMTDGRFDDLAKLKQYTQELAEEIASSKRHFVKCVLVGVGEEVDEQPLQELETLNASTNVKIWRYMVVNDLLEVQNLFSQVTRDSQIIAPRGILVDDQGKVLKEYTGALPMILSFTMPITSAWFELRLGNQNIRQSVVVPTFILGGNQYG